MTACPQSSTPTALAPLRAPPIHELQLLHQPKVDILLGKTIGTEALLRWAHPQRGLVAPCEFLDSLKEAQKSLTLFEWKMTRVVECLSRWKSEGLDLKVSINITPDELLHARFLSRLRGFLSRAPANVRTSLELELVESRELRNLPHASSIIGACEAIGVSVALDDFGTGYSSLTHIQHLPVSTIKIDQSFVKNALHSRTDAEVIRFVVGLGKALGKRVIAEGVETEELGVLLNSLGCHLFQGYAVAHPMPAELIPNWVRRRKDTRDWWECHAAAIC